jgi:hypothetical protein
MTEFCFVDKWPTLSAFAEDTGMTYGTAKAIRRKERLGVAILPDRYWRRALLGARRRGLRGVTLGRLAAAAEKLAEIKTGSAGGPA